MLKKSRQGVRGFRPECDAETHSGFHFYPQIIRGFSGFRGRNNHRFVWSSIVTFVFLGFALFLPHKSEAFFSFEEGCAFVECALVVEKDSWESSLSQMAISISSTGRSPAFLKSFFFLIEKCIDTPSRLEDRDKDRPCWD